MLEKIGRQLHQARKLIAETAKRQSFICLFAFCLCDLRESILDTLSDPRIIPPLKQGKRGLQLDRVVLLGRTFEEYSRYFLLKSDGLIGRKLLDVAGGVSSFCAEANNFGIKVIAFDPIYSLSVEKIRERCEPDLESVYRSIGQVPTYRWDFYQNPVYMRTFRERAAAIFSQISELIPSVTCRASCRDYHLMTESLT